MTTNIDLLSLVSACCYAADAAAEIIRDYHKSKEQQQQVNDNDDDAHKKDPSDPTSWVTAADIRAQKLIFSILRKWNKDLRLVGEEEEEADDEEVVEADDLHLDLHPAVATLTVAARHRDGVPLEHVTCFIDPVDGTRELVDGRVWNVCTLIGVAIRGEAAAGVLRRPFIEDEKENMFVGIVDGQNNNINNINNSNNNNNNKTLRLAASNSDADRIAREALLKHLPTTKHIPTPGAGNKIVSLLLGDADLVLMNRSGSLWDTCATEALVMSLLLGGGGGKMTDYFGARLNHSHDNPMGTRNRFGVIAGRDPDVVDAAARILSRVDVGLVSMLLTPTTGFDVAVLPPDDDDNEGAASDICRTVHGAPFTLELLNKAIPSSSSNPIIRFCCPESSSVRYKMAWCARLIIERRDGARESYFIKRSVMRDLPHARAKMKNAATQHKLARDVRSYEVESNFLKWYSTTTASTTSLLPPIARAVYCDSIVCRESPLDSAFCLILEDFSPAKNWRQKPWCESIEEMKSVVEALAKFHAAFVNGVGFSSDSSLDVWESGCYWSPERQAADQIEKLPERFSQQHKFHETFAEYYSSSPSDVLLVSQIPHLLVERGHALECARLVHKDFPPQCRTLIHGDLKAANLFFSTCSTSSRGVGFIDFQWTGWGLPAVDLAYIMCAAAGPHVLDQTPNAVAEREILKHYYDCFCSIINNNNNNQSFDDLWNQYRAALVDHSVTVFSYMWSEMGATPTVLEARGKKYALTANAVNKSPVCAAWLLVRVGYLLKELEEERK
eukprot:PhM_4_TR16406/c2_g1_i1/m.61747